MLDRGLAYHCYTTPAELDALREAQMARGEKPRYDGRWRPENAAGRWRLPPACAGRALSHPSTATCSGTTPSKGRSPSPTPSSTTSSSRARDGTPTYNFCVVVDDLDMRITHVIRGDDHVNNTPRQINMMRALGATPPIFAHLPTVLTPKATSVQAPRRARRAAVPRRRLPARSGGQLPRAARLVAWRRRGVRHRAIRRVVRSRGLHSSPGGSIPRSSVAQP